MKSHPTLGIVAAIHRTRFYQAAVGVLCATALVATIHAEASFEAWQAKFDFASTVSQGGTAVAVDARGNVAVTGFSHDPGDGDKRFYTAKYAATTGKLIWAAIFDTGFGANVATAVTCDSAGNVIVTGGAADASNTLENFQTVKYAAEDGAVLWTRSYNGPNGGADQARKVVVDSADNVIVAGTSIGQGEDIQLLRYSPAGTLNGQFRFTGAQTRVDFPTGLAVDSADFAIVTGNTTNTNGDADIYLAKINLSTQSAVWTQIITSAGSEDDEGKGVAVDGTNNVLVTGILQNPDNTQAFVTRKYTSGGVFVWERIYQSPVGDFHGPVGVAVDGDGNAFVTGTSTLNNFKTTIYTAKYAAADGALLWEKRSVAPDGNDAATGIAADHAGNVVVTGTSDHVGSHDADYYTVKYGGARGAVLWEQRFVGNFRGGGDDTPAGVVVDDLGDAIITGVSTRPHPNQATGLTGFVTIKYQRLLGLTGDLVPGAGVVGSGVPANSRFTTIGTPALADDGAIAALAGFRAGATSRTGILIEGGGKSFLPAVQTGLAPDVTGARYAAFYEPIIAPNGTYAFTAKLSGVPAAKAAAVFTNALNGALHLALQQGTNVPVLGAGVLVRSIVSTSLRNNELVALVTLSGTGVTTTNNTALLGLSPGGATLLLRTGQTITVGALPASAITRISVLNPALASNGHGRSQADGRVVAKVTLADARTAVLNVTNGSTPTPILFTGQDATTIAAGAKWSTFGLPAVGTAGANFVALGALDRTVGGITTATDTALVFSSNGNAFTDFAAENDPAASIPNTFYTGFLDPVVNANGNIAFLGTLRGTGVTAANRMALWSGAPGSPGLVARLGSPAPDGEAFSTTARYAGFSSIALPGGANSGPVFVAKLAGAGVTAANNAALFSVDSSGFIRRLLRSGDRLGTRRVASFRVLNAVPTAFGATRSFNTAGSIGVLVNFTNKTKAVIAIGIP